VKSAWCVPLLALGLQACTEAPVTLPLRSLEQSGDVSFVCVGADGTGRNIDACPDFESELEPNHLYALVTQTLRGEVAVVDLSRGSVLDLDRSTPGFDFLPIVANPVDIVSTPDGQATFVGVADVGREGILALPTTCIRPPLPDLSTWPACALPAAPGDMALVTDPSARAACDQPADSGAIAPLEPGAACPAAALSERRKLVVAVPELGAIAILDAQTLLELPQGGFEPCPVERWLKLAVNLPAGGVEQSLPPDIGSGCIPPNMNYGPQTDDYHPLPAGFAQSGSTLYIADRAAPVVHAMQLADPCEPKALPPLLPRSFESPGRVVTTTRVAVSPITTQGEQFVYAIDQFEGSVMAFDVTPGRSQRTPIVRPGARRLPFEPADRIAFSSPARDLTFALRDRPIVDPTTGVAAIGTYCDPDPASSPDSLGAAYRTSLDYSRGAAPRELRGVFGFIALASGQVAVIDVEDFDVLCRRPISSNPAPVEDFRGCVGDPAAPELYTEDGTKDGRRTVSGELSCKIVQQHRARAGTFVISGPDFGVRAPSLRNFPQLEAPAGGTLPSGDAEGASLTPKLLAVDFPHPLGSGSLPAQVFVGSTLYESTTAGEPDNELDIDPNTAERHSLALLWNQPRSFAPEEDYRLTYEGAFIAERPAGFLALSSASSKLADADAQFCSRGVQDVAYTRDQVGPELGVPSGELDAFARRHADYVQISSELVSKDDSYWKAQSCGGAQGAGAFFFCKNLFGTAETPNQPRDLTVLEAYQDQLVVEPRAHSSEQQKQELLEALHCCFGRGKALRYRVRAGHQWVLVGGGGVGFRHNLTADPGNALRCVHDCNPRRELLRSRAFEISTTACQVPGEDDPPPNCEIGYATPADVACVISNMSKLAPGLPGSECIFENLTHRFAVYRGAEPSVRDTSFVWQIAGGFFPLTANLAAQTAAVSPQSLMFVPQIGQLAVVDGAAEGLVLVSLDSVAVSRLFF
jgi:hypothetical protein